MKFTKKEIILLLIAFGFCLLGIGGSYYVTYLYNKAHPREVKVKIEVVKKTSVTQETETKKGKTKTNKSKTTIISTLEPSESPSIITITITNSFNRFKSFLGLSKPKSIKQPNSVASVESAPMMKAPDYDFK